jgi:hypothetical protein
MDKGNVGYSHNATLFSHKKNELLSFSVTWMEVEVIVVREVSKAHTNTTCSHSFVESK